MTRPRKRSFSWLPTGEKVRSCSTCSSLICTGVETSPISSRNIAPCGLHRAKTPSCASTAPVNAPFLCPNNSDSMRLSGYCERFKAMKLRVKLSAKRPLFSSKGANPERPMAAAAVPLPVPVPQVAIVPAHVVGENVVPQMAAKFPHTPALASQPALNEEKCATQLEKNPEEQQRFGR